MSLMKRPVQPQLMLTDRDRAICAFVFSYGGVASHHLQSRFFPTPGARAACYARLAKLVAAGYLRTTRLPSHSGVGSGPLFITLGLAARPLMAKQLGCSVGELRRATRARVPNQLRHHLTTCDMRLAVERATDVSLRVTSVEWIPEWELRVAPVKVKEPTSDAVLTLVADGTFTLSLSDNREQAFYVEIDMATMTEARRMRARIRGWLLACQENPVPVLWVTTTEARAATLTRYVREEAEKLAVDPTVMWIALHSAVTPGSVLTSPIWQVVGGPTRHTLLGAHDENRSNRFVREEAYA